MASESGKVGQLSTQQEKPNHYTYLKEFRVEQCQSFLQHKCNQHRPFVCFNWHFQNQRRRKPIRKRDGTFNYSADNYCSSYDETTGICPDGDDCPYLHRTAGDTERRYHLRYYKTCMCVHDTDSRGYCVKNGVHCAFAHGHNDQRAPVYDIKELESLQNIDLSADGAMNAPNALDKERNLMNEDPKWQDTNYVLSNYKTEPCKRPPRLCRQGYACPQYHNSKDKRRSPRKYKYRSTPCPNVKHGEEWGEPGNCEAGDSCQYCHTRTEQQFHPEIYKSTKCNDVQQAGYCPRSVFCAFAHVEQENIPNAEDVHDFGALGNSRFSELFANALPENKRSQDATSGFMNVGDNLMTVDENCTSKMFADALENPTTPCKMLSYPYTLDGLSLDDPRDGTILANNMLARHSAPINIPNTTLNNSLSDFSSSVFAASIANNSLTNYSPSNHTNLFSTSDAFGYPTNLNSKLNNSMSAGTPNDGSSVFFPSRITPPGYADGISMSPSVRLADLGVVRDDMNGGSSVGNTLFENALTGGGKNAYSFQSLQGGQNSGNDISRITGELKNKNAQIQKLTNLYDELNHKVKLVEIQRDKAKKDAYEWKELYDMAQIQMNLDDKLRSLSIQQLKQLQAKLRVDLEEVDKVLYHESAKRCMKCEENNRSVTLEPCNHLSICNTCASSITECPYCQQVVVTTRT